MAFHISLDALTVVVRKFRSVSSLMAEADWGDMGGFLAWPSRALVL